MIGRIACAGAIALAVATPATAASRAYDGSWALSIVTDRGGCDRSYDFNVQIVNGVVSHPNLVRLTGRVQAKGVVRVSVAVGDKYASGAGRLVRSSGNGRWAGYSGSSRCSGHWTARRY
jgi:hypothetical protein